MPSIFEIKKIIPAESFFRWIARVMAPLGILALWVGLLIAAELYPPEYDWRYMTVTTLLRPADNPGGHWWAAIGLDSCALCGLYWTALLPRHREQGGRGRHLGGIRALQFGYICMIFSTVLVRSFPIRKIHEIWAVLAFLCLDTGLVRLTFQTVEKTLRGRMRWVSGHAQWYAAAAAGAAAVPIVLAAAAQAYVHFLRPELPWVNLSWRTLGVPVYLSFAFWEWIACVVLSAYMVVLPFAIRTVYTPQKTG